MAGKDAHKLLLVCHQLAIHTREEKGPADSSTAFTLCCLTGIIAEADASCNARSWHEVIQLCHDNPDVSGYFDTT